MSFHRQSLSTFQNSQCQDQLHRTGYGAGSLQNAWPIFGAVMEQKENQIKSCRMTAPTILQLMSRQLQSTKGFGSSTKKRGVPCKFLLLLIYIMSILCLSCLPLSIRIRTSGSWFHEATHSHEFFMQIEEQQKQARIIVVGN